MLTHTPGPWYAITDGLDGDATIKAETPKHRNPLYIARVYRRDGSAQRNGDAQLIAAAPDLLATLRDVERLYPNLWGMSQVRAAIAKATGSA